MRRVIGVALLIGIFQLFCGLTDAAMYRWVDNDGVIHFSDTPPIVDEDVEIRATTPYRRPEPQSKPAATIGKDRLKKTDDNTQPVAAKHTLAREVEIYTTSWCGYCKKAIHFLRTNNIAFNQYDIEKDPQAAQRMKALGGRGGVPFAIINEHKLYGFSENSYKQALGIP